MSAKLVLFLSGIMGIVCAFGVQAQEPAPPIPQQAPDSVTRKSQSESFPKEQKPQAKIQPDYWLMFNDLVEKENLRYAEENPTWPKGEPAPSHIVKKALASMSGKNILEAAREGVKQCRESFKELPEPEMEHKIELTLNRVLDYFPLLESTPQGHMNLYYVISSVNADPVFRKYLVLRSYKSAAPETLFTLYFRDVCGEFVGELLSRYKTIALEKSETPVVQSAVLAAYPSLLAETLAKTLFNDREANRFAVQNGHEIKADLLKLYPDMRMGDDTKTSLNDRISQFDTLLLDLQKHFAEESTRPDYYKNEILDLIEKSLEVYALPSAEKHLEFLKAQGREIAAQ